MTDEQFDDITACLGGQKAIADRLGVGVSAVANWRHRGIPADKYLELRAWIEADRIEVPAWFMDWQRVRQNGGGRAA